MVFCGLFHLWLYGGATVFLWKSLSGRDTATLLLKCKIAKCVIIQSNFVLLLWNFYQIFSETCRCLLCNICMAKLPTYLSITRIYHPSTVFSINNNTIFIHLQLQIRVPTIYRLFSILGLGNVYKNALDQCHNYYQAENAHKKTYR